MRNTRKSQGRSVSEGNCRKAFPRLRFALMMGHRSGAAQLINTNEEIGVDSALERGSQPQLKSPFAGVTEPRGPFTPKAFYNIARGREADPGLRIPRGHLRRRRYTGRQGRQPIGATAPVREPAPVGRWTLSKT